MIVNLHFSCLFVILFFVTSILYCGYLVTSQLHVVEVLSKYYHIDSSAGHDINLCGEFCPVGQMRFNIHMPYSNFHLPLKKCMFHKVSFKTKKNMVLATCESIFSRTTLDTTPQKLHTFVKPHNVINVAKCNTYA